MAGFNIIMGQMTEMSQCKKNRFQRSASASRSKPYLRGQCPIT